MWRFSLLALLFLVPTAQAGTILMGTAADIDDNATAGNRDFYLLTEAGTDTNDTHAQPSTVRLHKDNNGGTDTNAYSYRFQPGSGLSKYYRLTVAETAAPRSTRCRMVTLHGDTLPAASTVRRILELRECSDGACSGTQSGAYAELKSDGAIQVRYGGSAQAVGSATSKHLYQRTCCDTSGAACDPKIACSTGADCTGGQCGAAGTACNSDGTGCYWGSVKLCETVTTTTSVRAVLWWDGRKEVDSTFTPSGQTARGIVDVYMGGVGTEANTPDFYVGSWADDVDPDLPGFGYVATAIPTGMGSVVAWTVDNCGAGAPLSCVNDWLGAGAFDNSSGSGDRLATTTHASRTEQFADSTAFQARSDGETIDAVAVELVGETPNSSATRKMKAHIGASCSGKTCDESAAMDQLVTVPNLAGTATLLGLLIYPNAPSPIGESAWTNASVRHLGLTLATTADNNGSTRLGAFLYLIHVLKPTKRVSIVGADHNLGQDDGKYCHYTFGDSTNAGAFEAQCSGGSQPGAFCLNADYCSSPLWDATTFKDKPVDGCGGNNDLCKTCANRRDDTPTGAGFACDCDEAGCTSGTPAFKCQTGTCSCTTQGCGGVCSQNANVGCDSNAACDLGDCDYAAICAPSCPDGGTCPPRTGWGAYVAGRLGVDSEVKCGFGSLSSVELAAHLTTDKVLAGTDPSCTALIGAGKCGCSSNFDCGACSLTTTKGCSVNTDCPTGETCTTGTCSQGGSSNVTFQPTADTYMTQGTPTTTHDTETILRVGRSSGSSTTTMRSLLRFDVSSIPYGANIDSAVLTFTISAKGGNPSAGTLYELASGRATWSSLQATWTIYKTASNWGTAGALNPSTDYVPAVHGNHGAVTQGVGQTFTVTGLESLIQDALTSRSGKADLVWGLDTLSGSTYVSVNSTAAASGKPSLAITYSTPVGPPTCTAGPAARTSCQRAYSDCNCNGYGGPGQAECPNVCRLCPPDDIDILWGYNDKAWTGHYPRCRGPIASGETAAGKSCSSCGSHALCFSNSDCADLSSDSVCVGHLTSFSRLGRTCAFNEPFGPCTAYAPPCTVTNDCPNGMTCSVNVPDDPAREGYCMAGDDHAATSCPAGSRPTCADDADTTCGAVSTTHVYAALNGVCRLKCGRCSSPDTSRACATNLDCPGSETCTARAGDADADCKYGGAGTCRTSVPRVCAGSCTCPDNANPCTSDADCTSMQSVRGIPAYYAGTCVGAPSGHCSCSGPATCRLDAHCPDSFSQFYARGGGHTLAVDQLHAVQALIDALPETDGRPHIYPLTIPIERYPECRDPINSGYTTTYYLAGENAHIRREFPHYIDAQWVAAQLPTAVCHADMVHYQPACSTVIGTADAQVHQAIGTCATADTLGLPSPQRYCRAVDGSWPESGCLTDATHCSCTSDSDCSAVQTCEVRRCAVACHSSADCVNWFGLGHSCVNGACNKGAGTCSVTASVKCCLEADCPETETCNGATCNDSCAVDFGAGFAFDGTYCTHATKDRCPATGDDCVPE